MDRNDYRAAAHKNKNKKKWSHLILSSQVASTTHFASPESTLIFLIKLDHHHHHHHHHNLPRHFLFFSSQIMYSIQMATSYSKCSSGSSLCPNVTPNIS